MTVASGSGDSYFGVVVAASLNAAVLMIFTRFSFLLNFYDESRISSIVDKTTLPLLNWPNITEWRDVVVDAAIQKFAPARNRNWLLSQKPDTHYWDTYEWYEPLRIEAGIEDHEDFLREFGLKLPSLFGKLRGVHLCRPTDFQAYKNRGILRLNPLEMQVDLMAFLKSEHPELTDEAIQWAIDRASKQIELREAKVFFGIDERFMLEHAGHYAVFGSEYQLAIAAQLGSGERDYRQTLRRRGRPAYVVIHLPMSVLDDKDLEGLAGDLLPAAISSFHLGLERPFATGSGWDIDIDVPSEWVQDVVHAPVAKSHWAT